MATRRYSLVLVASLIVAAIATFLVFEYISASTTRNQIATLAVVVAAKDIPEGAEIQEADVRVEQWPEPVVPENAFESAARVAGRVSHVPIYAGEAIVPGRLAPEGATPGLEAKISPGKRAMGVRINDVSGMNGMIQPNSRVDILLTVAEAGSPGTARLFMENMRVLAMGADITRTPDGRVTPSTVAMIEVTPAEAERLAVATAQGQIQLVLRGFSEPAGATTKGSTAGDVTTSLRSLGQPRNTRPAPKPTPVQVAPAPVQEVQAPPPQVVKPPTVQRPESTTIQVWRGPKRSDEKLTKDSVKRDTIKR